MRVLSLGIVAFFGFAFLAPASSSARDIVHLSGYPAGTIVIKTSERRLSDYVTDFGSAIRYPVGVGKAGMAWSGKTTIDGKYIKPAWQAPELIRKDYSRLAPIIPGGESANPMGSAAMTLSGGGQYAIHGTNNPGSVSHPCHTAAYECTTQILWICMRGSVWVRRL